MTKTRIVLVVIAVAAVAVWLLRPTSQTTPEEQVRALVAECVAAASRKDIAVINDALDQRFRGPSGTGKQEVKATLVGQFFRAGEITVFNPTLDVEVESPSDAKFHGKFVFVRAKVDRMEDAQGQMSVYEIEGRVAKMDDGWKFVQASYRQAM